MAHNFGNYLAQQRELVDGRAWVQLPMEAVTVSGVDRFSWLNNITTAPMLALQHNNVNYAKPSSMRGASESKQAIHHGMRQAGIETLILDAAGHIMFACAAADDGERTWLLVDAGVSAPLSEFLRSMQFMARVEVEVTPIAAVGVMLPSVELARELTSQVAVVWEDPWSQVSEGGAHYGVPDADHPAALHSRTLLICELPKGDERVELSELLDSKAEKSSAYADMYAGSGKYTKASMCGGQPDRKAEQAEDAVDAFAYVVNAASESHDVHDVPLFMREALEKAGYSEASHHAWEALRIADWRPRSQTEVSDDRVMPHELDWLRTAVWLNKGCFPGQETVAKIVNMGRPPRRLVFLYVEGAEGELPAAGTQLTIARSNCDGTAENVSSSVVGVVTSIGRHYELGPIALALIKRTVPADAILEFADSSGFIATQEIIVSPHGRSSVSPREIPGEKLRKARAALSSEEKPQRHR